MTDKLLPLPKASENLGSPGDLESENQKTKQKINCQCIIFSLLSKQLVN